MSRVVKCADCNTNMTKKGGQWVCGPCRLKSIKQMYQICVVKDLNKKQKGEPSLDEVGVQRLVRDAWQLGAPRRAPLQWTKEVVSKWENKLADRAGPTEQGFPCQPILVRTKLFHSLNE